jgi:hypothetical protein
MLEEKVQDLLTTASFKFASSMPKIPHEYTHRLKWENDKDFCDVVQFIRDHGIIEYFGNKEYTYYYFNGYKYWTMGNPLCYSDRTKTFILNRAKI